MSRRKTCHTTGKQRYGTERTALIVLVGLRARRVLRDDERRSEERAYRCEFCKGWHLTSTPYRPTEGAA